MALIRLVIEPDHFDGQHIAGQDCRFEDRQDQALYRLSARLVRVIEKDDVEPVEMLHPSRLKALGAVGAGDRKKAGFLFG